MAPVSFIFDIPVYISELDYRL